MARLLSARHPAALLSLVGRGLHDSAAFRLRQAPANSAPPTSSASGAEGGGAEGGGAEGGGAEGGGGAGDAAAGGGRAAVWPRRQPLGGVLASAPVAAEEAASGEQHLFALGPDGTTWHRAASAGGWTSLGGEAVTVPLAAIRPDGLLSVVVGGSDGHLYVKPMVRANGTVGWGVWASLGGPVNMFAC